MTDANKGRPLPKGFLKFGASGVDDVERAKAEMLAAREPVKTYQREFVPQHVQKAPGRQHNEANSSVQVEEIVTDAAESVLESRAPARQPAPPQPQQQAPPAKQERQVLKNERFTAEIFRNGPTWVAQVTYEPFEDGGAPGTERFTAKNRDELLSQLLSAKAHATLKIRENTHLIREGFKPDPMDTFFQEVQKAHGLTKDQYAALPEQSRNTIKDTVQSAHAAAFINETPSFYRCPENFQALGDYLNKQHWPLTAKNLSYAFRELSREKKLLTGSSLSDAGPSVPAPPAVVSSLASPVDRTAEPERKSFAGLPRKRGGSTGLIPGQSSAASVVTKETPIRRGDPETAELRSMPMDQLRRAAIPSLNRGGR